MNTVKVLSVRPPWGSFIVSGQKPVENRKWKSNYRGRLYIHSSKTFDEDGARWISLRFPLLRGQALEKRNHAHGFIIGHVDMVDCVTIFNSRWFFGKYGFVFTNPVAFDRQKWIPLKGQLGIFNIPEELVERI